MREWGSITLALGIPGRLKKLQAVTVIQVATIYNTHLHVNNIMTLRLPHFPPPDAQAFIVQFDSELLND